MSPLESIQEQHATPFCGLYLIPFFRAPQRIQVTATNSNSKGKHNPQAMKKRQSAHSGTVNICAPCAWLCVALLIGVRVCHTHTYKAVVLLPDRRWECAQNSICSARGGQGGAIAGDAGGACGAGVTRTHVRRNLKSQVSEPHCPLTSRAVGGSIKLYCLHPHSDRAHDATTLRSEQPKLDPAFDG